MADVSNSTLFQDIEGIHFLKDALVVLVKTEWNAAVVDELEKGCLQVLHSQGLHTKTLVVPGAVEIPFALQHYWNSTKKKSQPAAFIALGCVVRGDTPHFEYVCQSVTNGITLLNTQLPIPVIFGVLTVNTDEQARGAIGGKHGHKGEEAALTALKMMLLSHQLKKDSMNVQLFVPCFVDQVYPQTAFDMIKVLEKAGCQVSYNPNQTCCGQPAFNAGFQDDAREVCTKFLKDFDPEQSIVAPSASCVGFVRNYYSKLFADSSLLHEVAAIQKNVFELSEFLVQKLHVTDFGASLEGLATYHDSCAGLRECRIKNEPRQLLANVKGLELKEMEDVETCCGFGGTFAVKFEAISVAMGEQKVEHALATEANYLISTDLSCLMHLQGYINQKGYNLKTLHLADVLANGW